MELEFANTVRFIGTRILGATARTCLPSIQSISRNWSSQTRFGGKASLHSQFTVGKILLDSSRRILLKLVCSFAYCMYLDFALRSQEHTTVNRDSECKKKLIESGVN
jgi:hypothetical protein